MTDVHLVEDPSPFRAAALEQYRRGSDDEGHPLEIDPRWTRWADALIVAFVAAALAGGAWFFLFRGPHG